MAEEAIAGALGSMYTGQYPLVRYFVRIDRNDFSIAGADSVRW
jgi:hypothetical protein